MVGPLEFRGINLTEQEFEFLLGQKGAIETSIKEDPKPKVRFFSLSSKTLIDFLSKYNDALFSLF